MTDARSRRRKIETRETTIQDRTDEILKLIYKDGQILSKHRRGFKTNIDWLDALRETADAVLPSNPSLEARNLSYTEAALLWRPREMLHQSLSDLDEKLSKTFGEGLEPEERRRIANLAIDALRRGVEGKSLYEKTQRLKQVKTSRLKQIKTSRPKKPEREWKNNRETGVAPARPRQQQPGTMALKPGVRRLLSGDILRLDPEERPFSPNLLRLLIGGRVPRVKGATRLEDIARRPADRIE